MDIGAFLYVLLKGVVGFYFIKYFFRGIKELIEQNKDYKLTVLNAAILFAFLVVLL
ncbi:MAG: hypothetical protein H0Z32_15865 [Bacillaceae bacterium]|nr:hypothetical protein [Bacillaceae bacterium]